LEILLNFLNSNRSKEADERDSASHILSMLLEDIGHKNCSKQASQFLTWLMTPENNKLSEIGLTYAFVYILKINEIAQEFYDKKGMET
jgi:hypothetical protein